MIWIFGDSWVEPKRDNILYVNNDVIPWFTKFGTTKNFAIGGRGPKKSMTDFLKNKDLIVKDDIVIFVFPSIYKSFDEIDLDIKYYNIKNLGFLHLFHSLHDVKFFIMFNNRDDVELMDQLNITSIFNSENFYVLNFHLTRLKHPDDILDFGYFYVNHLSAENHLVFENLFQDFLDNDIKEYDFLSPYEKNNIHL